MDRMICRSQCCGLAAAENMQCRIKGADDYEKIYSQTITVASDFSLT
jgi:hypothetical protein